jgi:Pyruvate/2-oxoacid:ferredoxin oxidoreductase delta subunit
MRGTDTDHDRRLARLFKAYNEAPQAQEKKPATPKDVTPFMRVIPVEETLTPDQKVYTYEELSNYIDTADAISVGHCYCRHEAHLLGEEVCDGPEYRCMSFGPGARYTSERGIARLISKEEAHKILKDCQDAGLVHMGSNTTKFLEFLCNCCSCHCGTLRTLNESGQPIWTAPSAYYARVGQDTCEACESCVEICPMDAISMNDDEVAQVDVFHCIGCGVCANQCPADAIAMDLRKEIPSPPETPKDLRMAILKDYQQARS